MHRIILSTSLALLVAFAAPACDQTQTTAPAPAAADQAAAATTPLEAQDGPTLDLTVVEKSGDSVVVDLLYRRADTTEGPRVAEIWLQLSEGLTYDTSTAGEAADRASKDLTVQPKEGNQLRVVLMSSANLNRLDSGQLARLNLKRTGDAEATVSIIERMPVFAPHTAHAGMLLAEPLTITR